MKNVTVKHSHLYLRTSKAKLPHRYSTLTEPGRGGFEPAELGRITSREAFRANNTPNASRTNMY